MMVSRPVAQLPVGQMPTVPPPLPPPPSSSSSSSTTTMSSSAMHHQQNMLLIATSTSPPQHHQQHQYQQQQHQQQQLCSPHQLAIPIQVATNSAFRPIVPHALSPNGAGAGANSNAIGGDSFFLSAIHSLVLSSPSDDSASDSNHSSSDRGESVLEA
ncbi:unnamed protein product [Heligmosomoides polygyrus]|uniref:Uncharacterized protein n=1 Tax=Heligmosomoides polygyrus TaxID=6339 RepID=A0A183FD19_HELPZ|nr:unnamed protein product [Heligmosomoides polygyrus]